MEVLTPKLSIRNLNKSFDGKPVLKNLNFDVMEGEFLSVLGPSGCGKTTLLRILIGLETADSGEIVVAMIEDEATVKTFYKENGHYRLQPENSTMQPIIVDSVQILGRVITSLRYYH